MEDHIEMFMGLDEAYDMLRHALYQFNTCFETTRILKKYLDHENKVITAPPKVVARELMKADQDQLMEDDIFYFIEKALKDAYYQIQEREAGFELGCLYYFERYNHVNYEKAVKYFSMEFNAEESDILLGECYFYGRGVEQDYSKAFHCLVKCALADLSARACYLIGDMYYNGYYVFQDQLLARKLYWHAKQLSEPLKSCAATKAEINYRLGQSILEADNEDLDIDMIKMALQFYNEAEQMYIEAIQKGNPSLKKQLKNVQVQREQVKEILNEFLFETKDTIH